MRWLLVPLAVAALAAPGAQAQFYDLDGAYRCVTAPDKACAKGESSSRDTAQRETEKPEAPSLADAIARVKRGGATEGDIHLIEQRADAKEPRAIEVLAWCKLNGIGMKPDAVAAFWLYRDAAALGVPNAGKNQVAVFETRLSSAERQQVLMRENAR